MANGNWQGGSAKGRAQAKAWLRHNDIDHRMEVEHSNREIDKSRTHLNFEVGPTKGLTYEQKCERLTKIWDEWGYPSDDDIVSVTRQTPTSMQMICLYAPDALQNEEALSDGRLEDWFERTATEAEKLFGADNIISFMVDVDERHKYTDAETGERKLSKFHGHLGVAPVVEKKVVKRQFVYLRPDGSETLEESEAQQVYITVNNSETDDATKAARNDDGTPKMGPKHARMKNGRRKVKKGKRSEATETKRVFSGSEFKSEYVERLNEAIHKMTARDFGMKWNTHELGTYQRTEDIQNKSVEDLKAASVEREVAQRRAEAAAEIEQNLAQSEALLDEADIDRMRAECERNGAVFYERHGERMMAPLPVIKDDEDPCEFVALIERSFPVGDDLTAEGLGRIVEVRHAPPRGRRRRARGRGYAPPRRLRARGDHRGLHARAPAERRRGRVRGRRRAGAQGVRGCVLPQRLEAPDRPRPGAARARGRADPAGAGTRPAAQGRARLHRGPRDVCR